MAPSALHHTIRASAPPGRNTTQTWGLFVVHRCLVCLDTLQHARMHIHTLEQRRTHARVHTDTEVLMKCCRRTWVDVRNISASSFVMTCCGCSFNREYVVMQQNRTENLDVCNIGGSFSTNHYVSVFDIFRDLSIFLNTNQRLFIGR